MIIDIRAKAQRTLRNPKTISFTQSRKAHNEKQKPQFSRKGAKIAKKGKTISFLAYGQSETFQFLDLTKSEIETGFLKPFFAPSRLCVK